MPESPAAPKLTPPVHPLRASGLLTGTYLIVCILYIVISSTLAAQFSVSLTEMKRIELFKGILFIVLTGLLLFFFSLRLFRQVVRREKELQQHREALLAAERRATAGLFAASLAHDIRNVLTVCNCASADISEKSNPAFEHLSAACKRLNQLSGQLLDIGEETHTCEFKIVELMQIISETKALASEHTKAHHCRILIEGPERLEIHANPLLLHQMLLNLVLNAADAGCNRGTVLIRAVPVPNNVIIEVHDNGPGIPPSDREKIFRSFYTTKPDGTGLGLLAVQACAKIHQGYIQVLSSGLGGACFRITLPINPPHEKQPA